MKCTGVGFYVPPFAVSLLFKVAEEEMVQTGVKITEGLCMGILARSTESKFLCFAEEVAKYCREKCMMAIAMYGAWMWVYAYCCFYGRACDPYPQVIASSFTLEAIMYGCLSQELSRLAPRLDTQYSISVPRCRPRHGYCPFVPAAEQLR